MKLEEVEPRMPVRYFIHYPQIIHTTFRAAVYPIAKNPARGIDAQSSIFPDSSDPGSAQAVLIFSLNTCIVKGNRNSTSHA